MARVRIEAGWLGIIPDGVDAGTVAHVDTAGAVYLDQTPGQAAALRKVCEEELEWQAWQMTDIARYRAAKHLLRRLT